MNYQLKRLLLFPMNVLYSINPKMEIELMFWLQQRYRLNLKDPKTYNEKLNWQKLYYKNDLFSVCSDKYHVRDFVKSRGCGEFLNTLLWSGFSAEDIPFDTLPEKFVIKATHGSGFNIICKDKKSLNRAKTIKTLNKWLKTKYLKCYGERWYGEKRPRIVVEAYLEDATNPFLFDYKFFCFDGEPRYVYVDTWKNGQHHINMYDIDFKLLPHVSLGYPLDLETPVLKPDNYEEMLTVARRLSEGFPHVRVDLYCVNGNKTVFGEMTFSKGAGFDRIHPREFDKKLGDMFAIDG